MKRRCTVVELSKPYRKITLPEKSQRVFECCVLGPLLMYGGFVENAITISCPGGCISTLCSDCVIENIKSFGIRSVVVVAGTNNLFDKRNKPLIGPIETTDEMYHLIEKFKFYKFRVTIMALTNRKDKLENHLCVRIWMHSIRQNKPISKLFMVKKRNPLIACNIPVAVIHVRNH